LKVLFLYKLNSQELDYFRSASKAEDVQFAEKSKFPDWDLNPEDFQILVGHRVPEDILNAASSAQYLIIPFTGVPEIDLNNSKKFQQITLLNCHYNAVLAAEHAWALLLASAKRLIPAHNEFSRGDWSIRYERPEWSDSLTGKTLLLIGYGEIGKRLARFGRAFEMKILAVNRTGNGGEEVAGTPDDLPALLPMADFIIVSLPEAPETRSLLGEREFAMMKPGVHIVNIGRGSSIDEDAFYNALKSGKIGGAGIDVWWKYPDSEEERKGTSPSKHPIEDFDNVVMSPHRASHVHGRELLRNKHLAAIIDSAIEGNPMNIIDTRRGY